MSYICGYFIAFLIVYEILDMFTNWDIVQEGM